MENGENLRLWFSAVQTNKKTKNSDFVTSYLCALVRRGSFSFLLSLVNKACDEEMPERNQVS